MVISVLFYNKIKAPMDSNFKLSVGMDEKAAAN